MKTVAIIQARMDSTRLKGKILLPLGGKPVLQQVVDRMRQCRLVDQVVVATTTERGDDVTAAFCEEQGIDCFRGSSEDVLDRFYQTSLLFNADLVVRITADCPVIDPVIVDEIIEMYLGGSYDVCRPGTEFPDGLDCAVFPFRVLEETWRDATLPSDREHISPYMERNPRYRIGMYEKLRGLAHHRWTLDEDADYRFLQEIFRRLDRPGSLFLSGEILALLEKEPELVEINGFITRNEGYLKSLEKDRALIEAGNKESQ